MRSIATHSSRRRNHPCRGPVRRRSRRRHLLGWHRASRSPCSPMCRAERGRISPVGCWKNEARGRARSLVTGPRWDTQPLVDATLNQCSTLRCYKRTRCEWGYMPGWEERGWKRCIVACDTSENNGGTPRETTDSRAYFARPPKSGCYRSTHWMPYTRTLLFAPHAMHDLKSATHVRATWRIYHENWNRRDEREENPPHWLDGVCK